jgi:hypothetical protein
MAVATEETYVNSNRRFIRLCFQVLGQSLRAKHLQDLAVGAGDVHMPESLLRKMAERQS